MRSLHPHSTARSLALLAMLLPATLPAQNLPPAPPPDVTNTPGAIATPPRSEPAVEGLARRDRDSIALALPAGKSLLLHDFDFNGDPIDTAKIHLHQLSPGVLELTSNAYTVGYWRFRVSDAAAGYYGLGEHFDTLNHAHSVVRNLSMDNGLRKGSSAYKCIPFFMSTTGYGLWLDTTGEATFDMDTTDRDQVIVDAATNRLRILLFTGSNPAEPARFPAILSAFTALAGRAILPPYWAFAPWQARDYHQNQAQVLEDIDHTRALGLPASVILIDSPWTTAYNSYIFNPKQFDDAPSMIKHLHEAGYKLVLWHTSWINNRSNPPGEKGFEGKLLEKSPNYDEAAEKGFFVRNPDGSPWVGTWWKGKGSLIDFTNPGAKLWWQNQVRLAIAAGADGFKDDDAEGAFLPQAGQADVKFFDGTDTRLMRNRYGTLYNNAMEELIQKDLHGNGVLFARSVTTGANGIGFLWGGDNEASFSPDNGLPSVVVAGISAGISGMPLWGADIGGYLARPDTPNPLLLQRWTEFAAFSPMMEVMSSKNIVPWTFDTNSPPGTTPALDTYRKFVTLHMSMFPYRYAAAQQAAKTGIPLIRALVLDFQDDSRARSTKDEYLFGPDLLVAPVIDENTSRAVYLPAGEWLNFFTGEPVTGPRVVIAQAPPDTIPVYARRGAIIPKIPEDIMTLVPQSESGNKEVHTLELGAQARRVYELLGPAAATATSITDFEGRTVLRSENTLQIQSPDDKPAPAHIILRWRFTTPHSATVNGTPVPIHPDLTGTPTIEFDHTSATTIAWQ